MREDVVTAADMPQLEAQRPCESAKIAKRNVGHIAPGEPLEELALIHDETVVTAWDGILSRPWEAAHTFPELQTDHYLDGYRVEIIET